MNGTYTYKITPLTGLEINNDSGNVSIKGQNVSIKIVFAKEQGHLNVGDFEIYIFIAAVVLAVVAGSYMFIRRRK